MSSLFPNITVATLPTEQRKLLEFTPYIFAIGAACLQALVILTVVVPYLEEVGHGLYSFGFVDDYDKLGFNLSQGLGYRFFSDTGITLMREPGYPLLLAGVFKVLGYSLGAARLANVLLLALSCCAIVALTRQISTKNSVSYIAVLLFLIHPAIVVSEMRGGVEMPFILLLLLLCLSLYRALARTGFKDYLLAGLVLGITSSVRSTAILFPLMVIPVYYFFFSKNGLSVLQMLSRIAVLYLAVAVVLTPWTLRNYRLVDSFVPTASVQGVAAHAGQYICEHLDFDHGYLELDIAGAKVRRQMAEAQGYRFDYAYYLFFLDPMDEVRFNKSLSASVMQRYAEEPSLFLRCAATNVFNFWFAGKTWHSTWLNVAAQIPFLLLAALGLRAAIAQGAASRSFVLIGMVCYLMLVHIPIHSQARYSVPLIPILCIFVALWLVQFLPFHRSLRRVNDEVGETPRGNGLRPGARTPRKV